MGESVLAFAFIMGIKHSFEADHVATVATVASRADGMRGALSRGVWWGIGHSLTLLTLSSVAYLTQTVMTDLQSALLESMVGLVLGIMGLELLWRRPSRLAQAGLAPEGSDVPRDVEGLGFSSRALVTGLIHGAAGSAAIILINATSGSMLSVYAYVSLFSVGAMLGMAVASVLIYVPFLRRFARYRTLQLGLILAIGGYSVVLGALLMSTRLGSIAALL